MKLVRKIVTFLDIIVTWPIFFLSLVFPRNKYVWVFIGWHRGKEGEIFADNTKYLFLHTSQQVKKVTAVWLAKDRVLARILRERGYRSYYEFSMQGMWYALTAGYTVIDAFLQRQNFRLSGRSKVLQLLHGKGMKKKGYTETQLRKQDYIFGASEFTLNMLPHSFKKESKIYVTGYSRDDELASHVSDSDISVSTTIRNSLESLTKDPKNKIIWYAPTFRRGEKSFDIGKVIDPENTSSWLEKNNFFLFVSLHPKYREQVRSLTYPHIIFFDESDVYPLMNKFDILVTDYSSLFTDFILLDRPIVFYPYDIESYEKNEGFSFDYNTHTPGPKTYTVTNLRETIEKILQNDSYISERQEIQKMYHTYKAGEASKRIIETIAREEKVNLV